MIETGTWYLGGVTESSNNYKLSICATVTPISSGITKTDTCTKTSNVVTAEVGLPRLGEMFASQLANEFGDFNDVYTLTPGTSPNIHRIRYDGRVQSMAPSYNIGSKPSLYLKSNVKIDSGDGTPNKPFIISIGSTGGGQTGEGSEEYNATKGVNKPKLAEGMTPIKWNGYNLVETTESDPDWYDYSEKRWANATTADGSMWVWIPRYIYKITDGWHSYNDYGSGTVKIQFSKGTDDNWNSAVIGNINTDTSANASDNTWTNHPAFTFGDTELTGFWMAKFEAAIGDPIDEWDSMDNNPSRPIIITPNVRAWEYISIGNAFLCSRNMETNSRYGWGMSGEGIDTHLTKNIDWGAVAYLSISDYGKGNREKIWINNSVFTGCSGEDADSSFVANVCQNAYNTAKGVKASTTGTVYGVYDMNGGQAEFVAAYLNNGSQYLSQYGSQILLADEKYVDIYSIGTSDNWEANYAKVIEKKGDAIYESSTIGDSDTSWFHVMSVMMNGDHVWLIRGGSEMDETHSGEFYYHGIWGFYGVDFGFRPVLLVGSGL